jgi:hypothetical protein
MDSFLTPAAERFLVEWSVTLAAGGAVCVLLGCFSGWIIWRKGRRFCEAVEAKNRAAFADYEKTSDEISRIKSELAAGGQ